MIENVQVIRNIQIENCIERDIYVNFISNDWVGIDVQQSIKLFATAANSSKKETTAQSRNIEDVRYAVAIVRSLRGLIIFIDEKRLIFEYSFLLIVDHTDSNKTSNWQMEQFFLDFPTQL